MVRTVVAEDACPVGRECYRSGLIHLYDNVGGALHTGGYWEGLILPSVDDCIESVRCVHGESMRFSCVLYVTIVDDDLVAFVDCYAIRSEGVVGNTPRVVVQGWGTVEEVE